MESNQPKNHHYVPQCYLKNFLNKGKFYVIDMEKVKTGFHVYPRITHPKKICYIKDFYTILPALHGSNFNLEKYDPYSIEKITLNYLENQYSRIFNIFANSKKELTRKDAEDLTLFIIQLKIRNPFWLKNVIDKNKNDWTDQILNQIIKKRNITVQNTSCYLTTKS